MRTRFSKAMAAGLAAALLAGCAAEEPVRADLRPRGKPESLHVAVLQSDAGAPDKKVLTRGRISTKSGNILILEPDGSVTEIELEGVGHTPHFERPAEFRRALLAVIGYVRPTQYPGPPTETIILRASD